MKESGSGRRSRGGAGDRKGAGREESEREVKRCEEQSLLCEAAAIPHLVCKYSSLHHQLQELCGPGVESCSYLRVCVCVRVGGWLAGAADAISPKAINQTGSAVESVQIGLINAAAERESGVFVCRCGMLEGEGGAMEENSGDSAGLQPLVSIVVTLV